MTEKVTNASSFLFAAVKTTDWSYNKMACSQPITVNQPNQSFPGHEIIFRLYALRSKVVMHWSVVNLPEHKWPSPANPSLQVQLCPPTVSVQFAFTSQLWLPVMHSSISRLCSNDWKRDLLTNGAALFVPLDQWSENESSGVTILK